MKTCTIHGDELIETHPADAENGPHPEVVRQFASRAISSADRHESGDVRRAYRHATLITLYDGLREVVLT